MQLSDLFIRIWKIEYGLKKQMLHICPAKLCRRYEQLH